MVREDSVLYRDADVVPRLHSFLLSVVDDENGTPRPEISLELTDLEGIDDAWRSQRSKVLAEGLAAIHVDYRLSVGEFPTAMQPIIRTYGRGEGPFRADATRIKQRRIGSGGVGVWPSGKNLRTTARVDSSFIA